MPTLVRELILEPQGLRSTFYAPGSYPPEVIARLAHGYFENTACAEYQPPDCKESWNKPLIGRDVREDSTSWAQAAGGAISNARDVTRWMRAVFEGRVVPPKQQAEWVSAGLDRDRRADRRRLTERPARLRARPRRGADAGGPALVLRGR